MNHETAVTIRMTALDKYLAEVKARAEKHSRDDCPGPEDVDRLVAMVEASKFALSIIKEASACEPTRLNAAAALIELNRLAAEAAT